jgi:hypothetical protein
MSTANTTDRAPPGSAPRHDVSPLHRLLSLLRRPKARTVVDLDDTVGCALDDAEVLLAFAAQSPHVMKRENIQALTTAAAAVSARRLQGERPTAEELTSFWIAYDELGNAMAPVSALSIRSSMRLNAKRFPLSLLTATGMNAIFAIAVFIACILLQGFWGAGRELLDKAEALEVQKTDLQQRMQRNEGVLTRRQSQIQDLNLRLCPPYGFCPDEGFAPEEPADPKSKVMAATKPQLGKDEEAKLRAEKQLARAELREMQIVSDELWNEQGSQTERSQAVEAVIQSWYNQTNLWCEQRLLKILCPIKQQTSGESPRLTKARSELEKLNAELAGAETRLEEQRQHDASLAKASPGSDRTTPARPTSAYDSFDPGSARRDPLADLKRDIRQKAAEIEYLEAESLRAVLLNVRLTLANIANYLIPMLMGLLGALAFILRSLTIQLREHTYVHMSASLGVVRMCLGAVAGVFGTMLAPGSDGALKGLPPLIVPFVFGYGIEILFSIMDRVVGSFTQPDAQKSADRAPA